MNPVKELITKTNWLETRIANLETQELSGIDHGGLDGLADDDHTQYLLADGTRIVSGNLTVGDGTGAKTINIDGAAGQHRALKLLTAGSGRWHIRANNAAEGGSNAGSDFQIISRNDDGTYLGTPLKIIRSTGNVVLGSTVDIYNVPFTDYSGISTIVGWSSYTTKKIFYKLLGKTLIVTIDIDGTSNSTAVSLTIPYTSQNNITLQVPCYTVDNGGGTDGMMLNPQNTNSVQAYPQSWGGNWTASGRKWIKGQVIIEIG